MEASVPHAVRDLIGRARQDVLPIAGQFDWRDDVQESFAQIARAGGPRSWLN